nr:hypothetical protein [Tanacetum cinerariifolium]
MSNKVNVISTVDIKPNFLQPIGIKGIAKVAMGWFLGCDLSLDCREGGEENEQSRDTVHCFKGIFINQSKYALESLKKYGFESCDPVDTLMVEKDEDKEGKVIDPSHYCGMIGTLLYLTDNRPDLQFAICMCSRYEAWPIKKHFHADSLITLTAFADADHAGYQDTRHSTSGSLQFLGDRLISWSSKRQKSAAISSMKAEYIALSRCCA